MQVPCRKDVPQQAALQRVHAVEVAVAADSHQHDFAAQRGKVAGHDPPHVVRAEPEPCRERVGAEHQYDVGGGSGAAARGSETVMPGRGRDIGVAQQRRDFGAAPVHDDLVAEIVGGASRVDQVNMAQMRSVARIVPCLLIGSRRRVHLSLGGRTGIWPLRATTQFS